MISISRQALHSSKDLLFDGAIHWTNETSDVWKFGTKRTAKSAEALIETCGGEIPSLIPEEFMKSMSGIAKGKVPWPLVIPYGLFVEHLETLKTEIDNAIDDLDGYENTLAEIRNVIEKLQPSKIEKSIYKSIIQETSSSIVESFKPDDDGFVEPPVYSHKTATGRLVVKSGPSILTLKKEYRRMLTSRFNNGSMMMIDFTSLEPRVLRLLSNGDAAQDIYDDISKKFNGSVTRSQAKLATLKLLYGSSMSSIASDVGSLKRNVVKDIENYFGLPALKEKLSKELHNNRKIKNFWGRPLHEACDDHLLVSHYTQSTAVDVGLKGFNQIINKIESEDLQVVPCYLIHDAMIVDVDPSSMKRLEEIIKDGVEVEGIGHFNLSFKQAYLEDEE